MELEKDVSQENREYKDTVFVDLFYDDETAEKNLLSLYNALHDTDQRNEKDIHKMRVGQTLYRNFKNDISFEMGGKVLVFGEHQSTVNRNMPLRCLMYSGRAYEQLVDTRKRYKGKRVKIPAPEFYTFYNGVEEYPLEKELFLSDAYIDPTDKNTMELKVKVININLDKSHEILEKCSVLKEYSLFVDAVRKHKCMGEEDAIRRAVQECIKKGILSDYLKRKGSEVINMLIAEYDYKMDMEVQREEAKEDAKEELREEVKAQVREELRDVVKEEVKSEVREEVKNEVREEVKNEVREEVKSEVREEVKSEVREEAVVLLGKIFQEMRKHPEFTSQQIAKIAGCTMKDVEEIRRMFAI